MATLFNETYYTFYLNSADMCLLSIKVKSHASVWRTSVKELN